MFFKMFKGDTKMQEFGFRPMEKADDEAKAKKKQQQQAKAKPAFRMVKHVY